MVRRTSPDGSQSIRGGWVGGALPPRTGSSWTPYPTSSHLTTQSSSDSPLARGNVGLRTDPNPPLGGRTCRYGLDMPPPSPASLAVLPVAAALLAGCGGSDGSASSSGTDPASVMPRDAGLYFEAVVRP